ncbi:Interferon-induced GTP-binding protein Mx2 [Colletotrichum gloeosporioides]|uniref:Interferon-induced GTP-binding protein Mx2 n=1 Tax=Colletotrichum gloeosporioides TaxID=474922 RepID=A0A8H4CW58_COLGL|nr:Interferon-induced GTP-binding protein Mx2 [Colletotrichum gloeosporioides]KAF3811269.1 Interferon-induced GTP-binding protein Mx2 [Colletotrichum gloeosporioides]
MSSSQKDGPARERQSLSHTGLFHDPENNEKHRQIIEAMDLIRDLNIKRLDKVPQLVVCGAQSSGKSSVLGAIAGIPFPSGEKMCTRYVTKVTLDYSPEASLLVRISPGRDRDPDERTRLKNLEWRSANNSDAQDTLRRYMEEAHQVIFGNDTAETLISDDILLIKISGPSTRALQLVDLPGLIMYHSDNDATIKRIRELVEKYVKMPQSTILAVVPANYDFANAEILGLCKQYDPAGERTLGIITKPDTITAPDSQRPGALVGIMQGRDSSFSKFKWHVIRNLDTEAVEARASMEQRDRAESLLFDEDPWSDLSSHQCGISQLRLRLRKMYFEAVRKELPKFELEVERLLKDEKFNGLTDALSDDALQKAFQEATSRLKDAARDHAKGTYRYDINKLPDDSPAKLRSRVRDHDVRFRDSIFKQGAKWQSHAGLLPADPNSELFNGNRPPTPPPANDFIDISAEIIMASEKLRKTGGIELEGHYSPERINNLFWELSDGWYAIAEEHVKNIFSCCKEYFETITKMTFARTAGNKRQVGLKPDGFENSETVASRFVEKHLLPRLVDAQTHASDELFRIEEDRQDWMKNSDRRFLVRQKEHRQNVVFRDSVRERRAQQNGKPNGVKNGVLDTDLVSKQRELALPEDYRDHNAEDQLHAMQSHYEISRDIFISNVLMQVEERHFLRNLEKLIPQDLDLKGVKELIKEDDDLAAKREQLQEEKDKLTEAFKALQRCHLTG